MIIEKQTFCIYHCRIYVTTDVRREELIMNKAFKLALKHKVDLETFQGCPAAGPYFEASSESLVSLNEWMWRIKSYLRKFKHVEYR